MPALSNPRHEKFLQKLVVEGMSGTQAYVAAGYDAHDVSASVNACRLLKTAKVAARREELETEQRMKLEAAREQAIEASSCTLETIVAELDEARELARKLDQTTTMVQATIAKAKMLGLLVERKEVGRPGDFQTMSTDDLREWIRQKSKGLGERAKALQ